MKSLKPLPSQLLIFALLTVSLAYAGTMSKADYKARKSQINETYHSDRSACNSRSGNAKDVCVKEAKAKESVALAELEYAYTAKPRDRTKLLEVKAKSTYTVAKERCDDLSGNAKDLCNREAKTAEQKALADAKMGKEIGEAKSDAAADKSDADYKVAIEKCESLAGDAKSNCISAARVKFGKN